MTDEQFAELEGFADEVDREPPARDRGVQGPARSGDCSRRSTSGTSAPTSRRSSRPRSSTIDALAAASADEIDDVPEIGPEVAATVAAWFEDPDNRALIEKLREAGVRLQDEPPPDEGPKPLEGKTIVLTGGLDTLSRDEATKLAQRAGAQCLLERVQEDGLRGGG